MKKKLQKLTVEAEKAKIEEIANLEAAMPESHISLKIIYGVGYISTMLIIGTLFYSNFEGWSWIDALYFSSYTVTTVGYGDLVPTTTFTKLFTVGFMFIGVGGGLYFLSSIATDVLRRREKEWLHRVRVGRLRHLGHIGRHIKKAAGKFGYDRDEVNDLNDEDEK
ncbi:MAG TPA: potassium channel family protein [Candidatus Nanoarchaeia archaeon]|nr:potassium channel family protein [Candidatus Nanoarchaeia archaeon]